VDRDVIDEIRQQQMEREEGGRDERIVHRVQVLIAQHAENHHHHDKEE
jgi:hypothetical protein